MVHLFLCGNYVEIILVSFVGKCGKDSAQQVRNWPKENTYFRQVEM